MNYVKRHLAGRIPTHPATLLLRSTSWQFPMAYAQGSTHYFSYVKVFWFNNSILLLLLVISA
jgi:hypothetical protein